MAKQNGIIKIKGTIGDIAFYKSQDGHLAREKGGISASRIKNDAAFQRTRENMSEFGRAGSAGKLIRQAFRTNLTNVADNRIVSRLVKELSAVIKADVTSIRGQRNVLDGELELLAGFEFNLNANLSSAIYFPYTASIDRATGALGVTIPAFNPMNMISLPEGSTHFRLISGGAAIDFEAGTFESITSQGDVLALTPNEVPAINLVNQLTANSTRPLFLAFGIEFYQQVNGINYPRMLVLIQREKALEYLKETKDIKKLSSFFVPINENHMKAHTVLRFQKKEFLEYQNSPKVLEYCEYPELVNQNQKLF